MQFNISAFVAFVAMAAATSSSAAAVVERDVCALIIVHYIPKTLTL